MKYFALSFVIFSYVSAMKYPPDTTYSKTQDISDADRDFAAESRKIDEYRTRKWTGYSADFFPWKYQLNTGWETCSMYCTKETIKDNSWKAFFLRTSVQTTYRCHITHPDGNNHPMEYKDPAWHGVYYHLLKESYKKQEAKRTEKKTEKCDE